MIEEPIAGVDDLSDVSPHCITLDDAELDDKQFAHLRECIEWHAATLARLQAIHRRETGRDYVMPLRLEG